MAEKRIKITFLGGTGSVTGSNFLLEGPVGRNAPNQKKILLDCGLFQGSKMADDSNWDPFPYNPSEIDSLIITHAHVDHIGRIPKLYADGFRGKIYSTIPTKDLAEVMLEDTANILGKDKELSKIYTPEALRNIQGLWEGKKYHEPFEIGELSVRLKDAGHILGSALVEISFGGKKLVFTGDLGNSPSPLLPDTEKITDADYLIMESVYGDRNHEQRNERRKKLEETIEDNFKNRRTLIIPVFSLERAQELLFEINNLVENRRVPLMPIFLDSPLAIRLTSVYRRYDRYFNENAQKLIASGDDIFTFPGLKLTLETEESKYIIKTPDPKIIIAGSGMSTGGRVLHHEKRYLPNPDNIVLLTGYQSVGSIGRMLQEGAKTVKISGEEVPVRAKIVTISGYSGHKDSNALLDFVQDNSNRAKKIFIVLGEFKSSLFLAQKIRDNLALDAVVPKPGDIVELPY
jgi:metallo-beta-lactamase family protein